MKKIALVMLLVVLVGCSHRVGVGDSNNFTTQESAKEILSNRVDKKEVPVQLPVDNYLATYKRYGEYFEDRFRGYHVGDDIEVTDISTEVPVNAIADGVVKRAGTVSGYGGLIIVEHHIGQQTVTALYGHVDIGSSDLVVGDQVSKGEFLANLGDDKSSETDGERKHLHFALYNGAEDGRVQGYEQNPDNLATWLNPYNFFATYDVDLPRGMQQYADMGDPQGKEIYHINFEIAKDADVEYIPSLHALNIYSVEGEGTARDRSLELIRYFDADQFLTLNTVTIFSTQDVTVGKGNYVARRYDIEKKPGIANFKDQPLWRNQRHMVTDFRKSDGFTRYYVVASHPDTMPELYDILLASMEIN